MVDFTCYSPCNTCSNSPNNCTSCLLTSSTPYFWDGACHSDCKPGTIDIDDTKTCVNCNTTCKTCENSVDNCTTCNLNGSTPYLQQN